ncbi:MAG: hypothetical protein KDD19_00180 [Phaeodactylibacter sp.]|nr:hypothetical protein [Phaeodactylibacter sp.]MCB9052808.1 hypothetical protein [Lewinellaceae bacterium]
MYNIYGIRHHGPGSTRSLLRALEANPPDCLLIEAPADADKVLEYALHPGIIPPVAILLYDEKDLSKASYLPFASFSPEWQAIQYGLAQGIPIHFMDLPMGMQFQMEEENNGQLEIPLPSSENEGPIVRDPMGYIAELAGYSDSERWWEATFEQPNNDEDIFTSIIELNTALRDELGRQEPLHNRMREAYMRKTLRKVLADGYRKVAVICGAWHAPALHHLPRFKPKDDNALLKGLRKKKVAATWIPWSYNRLAFQSGYRAGVISPAWYELLFSRREEAVQWWMVRVAVLLRKEGFNASAAHATEASRLAHTLAALRRHPIAGIEEMKEAALAVFCNGNTAPLQLIERQLIIGEEIGEVPADIPQIPLQRDLESRIRSLRLTNAFRSSSPETKALDLRKPNHLDTSHLLHQLNVLGIPWGTLLEAPENRLGNFHENWRLEWKPEFIIKVIEAGMWGNTVCTAATFFIQKRAGDSDQLSILVGLAREALLAGITAAFGPLVARIEDAASLAKDVFYLMEALPTLADIARYGDTRQTDVEAVKALIRHMAPRICIGLPNAVLHIEEEPARQWLTLVVQNNRAISLLRQEVEPQAWINALEKIANTNAAHPLIRGLCARMLFDRSAHAPRETARLARYSLSASDEAQDGALWLEGFLYGSGLLLIHIPELWAILDEWITEMPDSHFHEILPLVRRAFSSFTAPEREKMLRMARMGQKGQPMQEEGIKPVAFDQQRAKQVLPTVKMLLGLE